MYCTQQYQINGSFYHTEFYMTSSNRSTLWYFYLPCRQLSKLVDCQVNLNGERARGPLGCRQCQKCVSFKVSEGCQEWRSPPESDNAWDGEDWCLREDTERVCVSTCCHTWKRVGKNMGPCVAMLCVDVDTVHGCCNTTGLPLFRSKQVCCTRNAEWSQEVEKAKAYRIGTKPSH